MLGRRERCNEAKSGGVQIWRVLGGFWKRPGLGKSKARKNSAGLFWGAFVYLFIYLFILRKSSSLRREGGGG